MADPFKASQVGFQGDQTFPYRLPDPGRLEPDDFYINDIILSIPPENIRVEKRAFNHEWQTLRTVTSQKAKSGHSLARVSFDVVFKLPGQANDEDIRLIDLVAGLRATPFCVVHNSYLERVLGAPDASGPVATATKPTNRTIQFKPIMLAIASMTFSTLGHEGKPDCIRGSFDFLWFNYLPLTKTIAFKTGPNASRPGHAWESAIWKQFYGPFANSVDTVTFPHREGSLNDRTTEFMWREFLTIPKGDPNAAMLARELVDTLSKRPSDVLQEINLLVQSTKDMKNPGLLSEGGIDVLMRSLVKKGVVKLNDEMHRQLKDLKAGALTAQSGHILFPLLRELGSKKHIVAEDLNKIKSVVATLDRRAKTLQGVAQRGDIGIEVATEGQYKKVLDADMTYGKGTGKTRVGSFQLYGRKKRFFIRHDLEEQYKALGDAAVIQQIVVSFENILASIPMVGYRYPLLQHVGSMDARVNLVINAKNDAAGELNTMYDTVDTMALRYKQIPAGFTNLYIKNDFLALFGLSEFITEQIATSSISNQPARSMVTLSLTQAGVTSNTRVDNPEDLQQERVTGDIGTFKLIWNTLNKNLIRVGGSGKKRVYDINGAQINPPAPTTKQYYFMNIHKVSGDNRSAAYYSIVKDAKDAYNKLVNTVHDKVFGFWAKPESQRYYVALLEMQKQAKSWGFSGGIDQLVADVNNRIQAKFKQARAEGAGAEAVRWKYAKKAGERYLKHYDDQVKYKKTIEEIKKLKNEGYSKDEIEDLKEETDERKKRISELGASTYLLSMRKIFSEVTGKYRALPEFKEVSKIVHSKGLGKGIMAYPDFKQQLASVASWAEGKSSNAILMQYEPDCYLWYDGVHGGASSPLSGVVDDYYIYEARRHSLNIWRDAYDSVNEFFKTKYTNALNDPGHMGPHDVLVKDFGSTELAQSLYDQRHDVINATRGKPITKSVICDPNAKFPINWYPADASLRVLGGNSLTTHTTDMEKQWRGTQNTIGPSTSATPSPTAGNENMYDTMGGDTQSKAKSSAGVEEGKHRFDWPVRPVPGKLPKGYQFGVPRRYRGGYHSGLDMPRPIYRKVKNGPGDGIYGQSVYAARDGRVWKVGKGRWITDSSGNRRNVGGHNVWLSHGKGWLTSYYHLLPGSFDHLKKGDRVRRGQQIAKIGRTGIKNSPTHLHFGVRHKGEWVDPLRVLPEASQTQGVRRRTRVKPATVEPLSRDVTSTLSSPMREAIRDFEEDLINGQGQSLMRAYPTFKLYFIEDDSGETKRLAFDDFFSYGAVQSIRVIRSRKIAADLCELMLTNVSGVLSNRKFRQNRKGSDQPHTASGQGTKETKDATKADTREENPIASLLLQEGIDIHLRLGYSSDPDRLQTVFNGVITEVQFSENEDLVRVVAQSHAIELVQDIKGIQKPGTKTSSSWFGWDFWGFTNDAATGRILEEMIAEPEVLHFGRWTPTGGGYGSTASRDLLTQRWTFYPQPADDNIFAPSPEQDMDDLGDGTFFKNMQYIIYRTTIWDIFQEMTLRHPNFIASPVPYRDKGGERMTMFFGLPNQLYFARHPNAEEERADARLKNLQEQAVTRFFRSTVKQYAKKSTIGKIGKGIVESRPAKLLATLGAYASPAVTVEQAHAVRKALPEIALRQSAPGKVLENVIANFYRQHRLEEARKAGYIKPFRNYHLVTSSNHIVCNNIRANKRDVANTIVIKYGDMVDIDGGKEILGKQVKPANINIKGGQQEFTLKLDCALPTEEIRTQMGEFINVTNEELAKRYALGLLCRNLKEVYKGEVIVVGNPRIKPYDVCYMFDEYTDMVGAFEVEEVQHVFDQQHGFRTEIKPDMLVQAAEWSLLGSAEAAGVIMEGILRQTGLGRGAKTVGSAAKATGLSLGAQAIGTGLTAIGGFLAKKIINYTQLGHPVVMSPLLHHGRIFAGGVSTRKIPTSVWDTMFGEWDASADAGYTDWIEDKWDEVTGWLSKVRGQHSVGQFFNNGGDSPE